MVKLNSKTIKSKKNGKDYVLYQLESGDFQTGWFFPNSLTIEQFYQIACLVENNNE